MVAAAATGAVGAGLALYQYLKPLPPIPQLPSYSTSWLAGGHNQAEICEPLAMNYRMQFPDFQIEWRGSESSNKDFLGHVEYRYNCDFVAKRKK